MDAMTKKTAETFGFTAEERMLMTAKLADVIRSVVEPTRAEARTIRPGAPR